MRLIPNMWRLTWMFKVYDMKCKMRNIVLKGYNIQIVIVNKVFNILTMWTVVRGRKEEETEVAIDNYCKVCYETRRLEWRAAGNYDVVNQILLLEPYPDCPVCNGTGKVKVVDRQEIVK